jgi:hemerythrin superfamily protein
MVIALVEELSSPLHKETSMSDPVPFENAVDLLDADHKGVKQLFIDYAALCEDGAPAAAKRELAEHICQKLTIHTQIEEEIFYPAVRQAVGDPLMDEALAEHAEAKELIARIQAMKATSDNYDLTVKELGKAIDEHVLEEREQIFLQALQAPLDLRALAVPLFKRQKQLLRATPKASKEKA